MTVKVTITNDSDPTSLDNRIIEAVGGAGDKHIIGPGKSASTHVWLGAQIQITELEVKGESRGNRDTGYGAFPPA